MTSILFISRQFSSKFTIHLSCFILFFIAVPSTNGDTEARISDSDEQQAVAEGIWRPFFVLLWVLKINKQVVSHWKQGKESTGFKVIELGEPNKVEPWLSRPVGTGLSSLDSQESE